MDNLVFNEVKIGRKHSCNIRMRTSGTKSSPNTAKVRLLSSFNRAEMASYQVGSHIMRAVEDG